MKKICIAALSANAISDDKQKALDAGCDAYMTKSPNEDLLIDMLDEFFWLRISP